MDRENKRTYYLSEGSQEVDYTLPAYQQLKDLISEKEKRLDSEILSLKESSKKIDVRLGRVEDRKYDIIKTIFLTLVTFFLGYFLNSLNK